LRGSGADDGILAGTPGSISEKRLSLTPSGNIRYRLKTPY